jgi:competence protein ComFC
MATLFFKSLFPTVHVIFLCYLVLVVKRNLFHFLFQACGEFIYPKFCCACGKIGDYLCGHCYEQLRFYNSPLSLPLDNSYIDQVIATTEYKKPMSQLIHHLKYKSVIGIAEYSAQLMYDATQWPQVNAITSVPLHLSRQQERGFNQSEEIARHFSDLSNIPYISLLKRMKQGKTQASLSDKNERKKNLEGYFEFTYQATIPHTVILIDDVTTTGTTLNECAKVLKENGITKVYGLVLAHGN